MIALKDSRERVLHFHCETHHLALEFGEHAVRLISNSVAAVLCPGRGDDDDAPHRIDLDPDYVPFRLKLVDPTSVEIGSWLHPDRS